MVETKRSPGALRAAEKILLLWTVEGIAAIVDHEHPRAYPDLEARVERLIVEKTQLLDALEALRDEQNGPPLIQRAAQWQTAYDKANALLAKNSHPDEP